MKQNVREAFHRGLTACGFGPLVLVILYLILQCQCDVQTLTVKEVCVGILSLTALAFVAGAVNEIYRIERLPLMVAILIHGCVLYVGYLATYLLNDWLEQGVTPILVFTGIFVVGYLVIWVIIYSFTKRNAAKVNEMLKKKQHSAENA